MLASYRGENAYQIAHSLGCNPQTARNAIHAFNEKGLLETLRQGSKRPHTIHRAFDAERTAALRKLLHQKPRRFGKDTSLPCSPSPSSDVTTDAPAFELGTLPGVPKGVQASCLLWLTAVAAGVLETIIRVIDTLAMGWAPGSGGETDVTGAISNVVIRVIVYTLVV